MFIVVSIELISFVLVGGQAGYMAYSMLLPKMKWRNWERREGVPIEH